MYECQSCTREFEQWQSCCQHMNALDHWAPEYECDTCTARFSSERAVDQHMDARGHWAHYCEQCERRFDNANCLKMHLQSRVHMGSKVQCPFCSRGFTSASGASHHLETGSCPNAAGVDRKFIYGKLSRLDRQGLFTEKLIGWHDDTWSVNNAWNGDTFECYICHRDFTKQSGLDQHLKSPIHQQNIYHCPNHRCGKQFRTLASMFNHLESESCGFTKFSNINKNVGNFLSGNRQIAFH